MCGIFGIIAGERCRLDRASLERTVEFLFRRSEERGKEASGLAVRLPDGIEVFKSADRASHMLRTETFRDFLRRTLDRLFAADGKPQGLSYALIGHSRLVTNGIETLERNNQPVITGQSVGIHNGIVVNDSALWAAHPGLRREAEVDTEVIYRLLDAHAEKLGSDAAALRAVFSEVEGTASIAYLTRRGPSVGLATNNGSLYVAYDASSALLLFASERFTLEEAAQSADLRAPAFSLAVKPVHAGGAVLVTIPDCRPAAFRLDPSVGDEPLQAPAMSGSAGVAIIDRSARPETLRRCTRCILPETFPFIEFDEHGVCSVCRSHTTKKLLGREALERAVEKYRSRSGEPDCIIAFSGGRDSAFGLHYLKRELGLNPIAFTYDWGMVTPLARRNQARLCGKLGVEHIIRSPDIRAKRRYIRLNLQAWLKRPDLGMIPLFSAGDKQFYHYGRKLRRETGVKLTFFCAGNELERTEFKTGFCGVRENQHGMVLNAYTIANKLKFLSYYAKQYALNPRYLNASLVDTLASYYSTYVAKDDFLYLFHYIPWDENEIMSVLVKEYGWEGAPDTETTWRIDDAFTPFHNYIYYTVAGFSEHDTYRSNQIRAGLLTRDEALRLVRIENEPRLTAMREYAEMIGVNLEEVMLAINAIPKLYR